MVRLLLFLVAVTAVALVMTRLVDVPGSVTLTWLGYEIKASIFVAILALAVLVALILLAWSLLRYIASRPAALTRYVRHRAEEQGLEALSQGLIAVGAGDRERARKFAALARRKLPSEPLTGLLRAQAAQLHGDRAEARRIFEAMAEQPQTELLGLRGLFLEARRDEELEAARQFAERAMARNPDLAWSVNALFELQCRAGDWEGALKTLAVARRQKHIDRDTADRRRAVLLTALAREAEESEIDRARELAMEAVKLEPGLVPAAELAGRLLVSQGHTSRAGRIIAKAWELSPHPDLALAYAHLRPGDSPRDRLARVRKLAESAPDSAEGGVAVATAAVEAREWEEARKALAPLVEDNPPARVCTLMARIEGGETNDQGRVREWLARAVRAPRDPAWTADGYVSADWAPASPITGALDAFQWKVPVESVGPSLDVAGGTAAALQEIAAAQEPQTGDGAAERAEEAAELRPDPGAPRTDAGGRGDEVLVVEATEIGAPPQTAKPQESAPPPAAPNTSERTGAAPDAGAGGDRGKVLVPDPDRPAAAAEPEVFVAPRAPDDPGPGGDEPDEEAEIERKSPAPSG